MKNCRFGRRALACALGGVAVLILSGCAGVLPKKHELAISSFKSFEATRDGYDKVAVNQSNIGDLRALGFDPDKSANIQEINYLQVVQVFLPRQDMPFSTVPPSVQTCIAAQVRCIGLNVEPKATNQRRTGSIFLDFFNFRRKTEVTGWQASCLFVLLDGTVIYKLWSGEPNVHTTSVAINPLGPIQDLGTALNRAIPAY